MAMKKYKVIWATPINIENTKRETGAVFEGDNKSNEIKKLIKNKYIIEVEE